jgi:hypothetical protein
MTRQRASTSTVPCQRLSTLGRRFGVAGALGMIVISFRPVPVCGGVSHIGADSYEL